MKYLILILCIVLAAACIVLLLRRREKTKTPEPEPVPTDEPSLQIERVPAEEVPPEEEMVELPDSGIRDLLLNLLPDAQQVTEWLQKAIRKGGDAMEVKIPSKTATKAAAKKTSSSAAGKLVKLGDDAVGLALSATGAVSAVNLSLMVVSAVEMKKIDDSLNGIRDSISKITDFQDNEYRSRVYSLLAHIREYTDFQGEILGSESLRQSKLSQLNGLEEECTKLLGQANLTLAGYAKKDGLGFSAYEKELTEAEKWLLYQEALLNILTEIADLRYTLNLGTVSRQHCGALLPIYARQSAKARNELRAWHFDALDRLDIDTEHGRRRRSGFDEALHFVPGLFDDKQKYTELDENTRSMIQEQTAEPKDLPRTDEKNPYDEAIRLIAKDGKIFYLPEEKK